MSCGSWKSAFRTSLLMDIWKLLTVKISNSLLRCRRNIKYNKRHNTVKTDVFRVNNRPMWDSVSQSQKDLTPVNWNQFNETSFQPPNFTLLNRIYVICNYVFSWGHYGLFFIITHLINKQLHRVFKKALFIKTKKTNNISL